MSKAKSAAFSVLFAQFHRLYAPLLLAGLLAAGLEPVDKLVAGPQVWLAACVFEMPGAVSNGAGVWE